MVCVVNLTAFHELICHGSEGLAALYLRGNPSPACRHVLGRLADRASEGVLLLVWADLDYGGLSIPAQSRRLVSPGFAPYRMDVYTLEGHAL